MRHLFLAVILACISTRVAALVVEPEQKPAISKSTTSKTVSAPAKAARTTTPQVVQANAPPSEESVRFYQAATSSNYDMMRLYLSKGADINCNNCGQYQGVTPLIWASSYNTWTNHSELIKFLIANGADVNQQGADGQTALMRASRECHTNHITLLGENGATANLVDKYGQDALFHLLAKYASGLCNDFVPLSKYIITKGALINRQNTNGITPLMYAASSCWVENVKFFLSLGADPSLKTKLGETALMMAEKTAVNSPQGSTCNQTYSVLSDPERYRAASSTSPPTPSVSIPASNNAPSNPNTAPSNSVYSTYAGNYSGNYSGDDNGPFQVTVEQDGNIKLTGKSLRNNQAFIGNGKMNSDGSLGITLGSISTGATFQGSINPKTGGLYGTWKNGEQAGNFSGSKQTGQTQAANPIEAIGGLLNVLNKALAK